MATHQTNDPWKDLLDPDESILWQGRPDGGFELTPSMIGLGIFALVFAGFALFWMIMASQAGGAFWMFGLLHFGAGAGLFASSVLGPSFIRKRTFYTLTNQRAFIAKNLPIVGRTIKSYPITATTAIEFKDGAKQSIIFASETRKSNNSTRTKDIGFERIDEAGHVLQLLRKVQKGQA